MEWIGSGIAQIYAALAMMPYASFLVVWAIVYLVTRNKKKTTRAAMDVTFVLLLGSVFVMLRELTGSGVPFWSVALMMLILAGLIGRKQNERNGRVDPVKLLTFISRSGFLLFTVLYLVLLVIHIGRFAAEG